jgi:hypothetical protein
MRVVFRGDYEILLLREKDEGVIVLRQERLGGTS